MRGQTRDVALWDVEERGGPPPRVREMTVGHVSNVDVDEFARRYHYTHRAGAATWRYGLWHDVTLWGVLAFNLPTRGCQESVFGPDNHEHVWHMGRLALADNAPRNSESRLIGGALRLVEKEHPDVWCVLTYAAVEVGHWGYVYQATNALYTGTGGDPKYHIDADGTRRGSYLSGYVTPERAEAMGWTAHIGEPKHRYVYLLGSKTQRRASRRMLRYPVLPYPKQDIDLDDLEA